jgi:hypothetical protein
VPLKLNISLLLEVEEVEAAIQVVAVALVVYEQALVML